MTYHLALPDKRSCNIAGKAIQTWKDHVVGVMNGTVVTFPIHLWRQAVLQTELQLLLLRQANVHPAISAFTYVYGPHDYNVEPFVPIGMETLVHDKPRRRKTFTKHCSKGYVLGTSFEDYLSWIMCMKETKSTQVSGKVFINKNTSQILT